MVSIVDFLVCSTSFCRSLLSLEATGLQVHWQGLSASQGMAARSVALASCHFSIKADRILSCFFPSCCTNVRICVCGKFLPISQRCPVALSRSLLTAFKDQSATGSLRTCNGRSRLPGCRTAPTATRHFLKHLFFRQCAGGSESSIIRCSFSDQSPDDKCIATTGTKIVQPSCNSCGTI